MKTKICTVVAALLAGALSSAPVVSITPVPQSDKPDHWWAKRFAEKQEAVKKGGGDVVFIGDSITHFLEGSDVWREKLAKAPYNALNLGFSGDRTEHVLWRLDHGELDGYKAKVVVLMIGTNNTGHRPRQDESPIDTIIGINEIIRKIRWKQPQAKIILHPILPCGERPDDPLRLRNDVVNEAIRQLADGQSVFLCDFNNLLLNADGSISKEIMPDFLHPSEKGRKIWMKALLPMV
ncbi:MAG: acetylglucosamine-6-sulfatase, partial [Kiritimatiellae bacterium]|nr:acetylglucosamine-6-sulfatase [Kiritimatiellia bacterium]